MYQYVVVNFISGHFYLLFCFNFISIHYHAQKQKLGEGKAFVERVLNVARLQF